MPDFVDFPLWWNSILFAISALIVWSSGTRLSVYADQIADRTGIGKAFIGALLLGGATSLPEFATTVTASHIGNAPLAVNNVLGGIAMQVAVLAVVDGFVGGHALSSLNTRSSVLLQGSLLNLVLAIIAFAVIIGDVRVWRVGLSSPLILACVLVGFFLIHRHKSSETWMPARETPGGPRQPPNPPETWSAKGLSWQRLIASALLAGAGILVGGAVLARVSDALAAQTGWGAGFVGLVLLAVATSLPEVSTTFSAVRLGMHGMAISNIFGSNLLDASALVLADAVYFGEPVLNEAGTFSAMAAALGIAVTSVSLVGLIERRRQVVFRLGVDSLIILVLYLAGVILLYQAR